MHGDGIVKPYFEENGITIYHGDCRQLMLTIGPVDAVVTDPPYGDTSLDWDRICDGWMGAASLLTNNVWFFGSLRLLAAMLIAGDLEHWTLAQEIVWEKHNGSGMHADRFKRIHEFAFQFYYGSWEGIYKDPVKEKAVSAKRITRTKKPAHYGQIGQAAYSREVGGDVFMRSVIYVPSMHGKAEHPTQKPVGIIDPLIRYSVPEGGLVADLFCGSGSTLVAARMANRRAVGVEIQERYCEIAAKRLQQQVLEF
jgi:site-specific DNA-methyltransferase (adenine-specific)